LKECISILLIISWIPGKVSLVVGGIGLGIWRILKVKGNQG